MQTGRFCSLCPSHYLGYDSWGAAEYLSGLSADNLCHQSGSCPLIRWQGMSWHIWLQLNLYPIILTISHGQWTMPTKLSLLSWLVSQVFDLHGNIILPSSQILSFRIYENRNMDHCCLMNHKIARFLGNKILTYITSHIISVPNSTKRLWSVPNSCKIIFSVKLFSPKGKKKFYLHLALMKSNMWNSKMYRWPQVVILETCEKKQEKQSTKIGILKTDFITSKSSTLTLCSTWHATPITNHTSAISVKFLLHPGVLQIYYW